MKKLKLILLFILLFPISLLSQSSIGFKVGLLRTPYLNYEHNKYERQTISFRNSFGTSIFYNEKVSKVLSLGVSVYYDFYNVNYYNSWYTPMGGGGKDSVEMKFGYIGLSFFPQLNFGNKFSFFINAGPYFGFLTNSNAKGLYRSRMSIYDSIISYKIDGKASDYLLLRTLALMSNIGFRYEIDENWYLLIDASIRYGPCLIEKGDIKSQIDVIFSAGFLFQFEKKRTKSVKN